MRQFFLEIGWGWTYFIYIFILFYGERFAMGKVVEKTDLKVNYSRKVNHFFLFFSHIYISNIFNNPSLDFIGGVIAMTMLGLSFNKFSRTRLGFLSNFLSTCFQSFDRPEDRPYTLRWLLVQYASSYLVVIPSMILFRKFGMGELAYVPLLINAIGDGLAEPVGVTWGKRNRYRVKSLFGNKKTEYFRSWAGSSCVFFSAIGIIALNHNLFNQDQLWMTLTIVPFIVTFAEARSPHTVDSPFILLAGYASLGGIFWIF